MWLSGTCTGLINQFTITEAGKLAAKLPLDRIWYCALSAAIKFGCVEKVGMCEHDFLITGVKFWKHGK